MTKATISQLAAEQAARREAAVRSMWSDNPLNLSARQAIGETFTLRQLIAFVTAMPADQFEACTAKQREQGR